MNYNFFLIGGDLRICYLANILINDGHSVKIMGFEKLKNNEFLNNRIKKAHSISDVEKSDIIVSSVPFSIDGENIYAPFSERKIKINELSGKKIIAGGLNNYLNGYDILKDEATAILNSVPTAEGAISMAIEESKKVLFNENVLVLGFGRVGKILCNRLKGMGVIVHCEARKESDLAWIDALGYKPIHLKNINEQLCKMKIIFNTVPNLILDESKIILLKKDTIIIDLASGKGGTDFNACKKLGIKSFLYSGIPGKIAPQTSAEYIKRYVYRVIKQQ